MTAASRHQKTTRIQREKSAVILRAALDVFAVEGLLEAWLSPVRELSATGEPLAEILTNVRHKPRMSQEMPRESKLFATEILHGAPRTRAQTSFLTKRMLI